MRYPFAVVFVALFVVPVHATVVDFTQMSIGTQASITYQGVTVQGSDSPVSMVQGVGLGVGANGSYDYVWARTTQPPLDHSDVGGFRISVDGHINSITLNPYMTFDGPPLGNNHADFVFHLLPTLVGWGSGDMYKAIGYPLMDQPYVLTFSNCFDSGIPGADCRPIALEQISLRSLGETNSIRAYEVENLNTNYVVRYGFSLVSIDYAPTVIASASQVQVAEPSALPLLSVGLIGIAGVWRRRKTAA